MLPVHVRLFYSWNVTMLLGFLLLPSSGAAWGLWVAQGRNGKWMSKITHNQNNMKTTRNRQKQADLAQCGFATSVLVPRAACGDGVFSAAYLLCAGHPLLKISSLSCILFSYLLCTHLKLTSVEVSQMTTDSALYVFIFPDSYSVFTFRVLSWSI